MLTKEEKILNALKIGVYLFIILAVLSLFGAGIGIYKVNTGEAAIYTGALGTKTPVTDVGIHVAVPIFSHVEKYSTVNNIMYMPSDYLELSEEYKGDSQTGAIYIDITSSDNKVIDVAAQLTYEIDDVAQYGIQNTHPDEQMQAKFDTIVMSVLQSEKSDNIISNDTIVNAKLLQAVKDSTLEEQYGVTVSNVELIRHSFTPIALQALAEKQAIQALAEGNLNAAKSNAEATRINTDAEKYRIDTLKGTSDAQLDYNSKIKMYEALEDNSNVVWVIPYNSDFVIAK